MSRKIRFTVGPRNSKDEDRLIKYVFANARADDDVGIDFGGASTGETPVPKIDEAAERRIAEVVTGKLEELNANLDRKDEEGSLASADEKAEEICESVAKVKSWRVMMNEVGMKFFIELVLKAAWQERVMIWEYMKTMVSDALKSGLE